MSNEAFEKWWDGYDMKGEDEPIDMTEVEAAYEAGQNQRDEEVERLQEKLLMMEGIYATPMGAFIIRAEKGEADRDRLLTDMRSIANWVFGCVGYDTAEQAASGMNALAEKALEVKE
jgi:hypothetical protein